MIIYYEDHFACENCFNNEEKYLQRSLGCGIVHKKIYKSNKEQFNCQICMESFLTRDGFHHCEECFKGGLNLNKYQDLMCW